MRTNYIFGYIWMEKCFFLLDHSDVPSHFLETKDSQARSLRLTIFWYFLGVPGSPIYCFPSKVSSRQEPSVVWTGGVWLPECNQKAVAEKARTEKNGVAATDEGDLWFSCKGSVETCQGFSRCVDACRFLQKDAQNLWILMLFLPT